MKSFLLIAALALDLGEGVLAAQDHAMMEVRAPKPTPGPNAGVLNRKVLKPRAITADGYSTCGFISSDSDRAVTCDSGYRCSNVASVINGLTYSIGGCCPTGGSRCTIETACYDSTAYRSLTRYLNDYELACTSAGLNYCKVYTQDGYKAYGCDTAFMVESVYDLASGSVSSYSYSQSSSPYAYTTSSSSSSSPMSSATSTSTSPTMPPDPAQTSGNPAPIAATSTVSLSTGAIVGIAIAGAAVLLSGICAIAIICCLRYRRRRNADNAVGANAMTGGPYAGNGMVATNVVPATGPAPGFGYTSFTPGKEDRMSGLSGPTYVPSEHFVPGKMDGMPYLRPSDAPGEVEIGNHFGSSTGHTVTSVAGSGYNPPRV